MGDKFYIVNNIYNVVKETAKGEKFKIYAAECVTSSQAGMQKKDCWKCSKYTVLYMQFLAECEMLRTWPKREKNQ